MNGFLTGVFALVALEVLLSNARAKGAVTGVFGALGNASQRFFDPSVPAIGPRRPASAHPTVSLTGSLNPTLNPALGQ